MDFAELLYEVIDFRSFSNLWYWIVLAAVWSQASHYVMGVPWDMVMRARHQGGDAERDLHDIVRINTTRYLFVAGSSGLWLLGFAAFVHSTLLTMAVWYDVEWAQAVEFIGVPMTGVGVLTLGTATRIAAEPHDTEALYHRLRRHRLTVQVIGMVSLFITALFGMLTAVTVLPLY